MDNLLRLYRYLSTCSHAGTTQSAYTGTYRALEPVLDLLHALDHWGAYLLEHGGMDFAQARTITERIIEAHKTGLCEHATPQSALEAIVDFTWTHLTTQDRQALIKRLQVLPEEREDAQHANT